MHSRVGTGHRVGGLFRTPGDDDLIAQSMKRFGEPATDAGAPPVMRIVLLVVFIKWIAKGVSCRVDQFEAGVVPP